MKKNIFGRKFKRDIHERNALFKGLMSSLVLQERIETTEEKAKAIKGEIDKLVNKARGDNNSQRFLNPYLNQEAIKKIQKDIAKRFNGRTSGYTRIIKLGNRFSDNASMAIIEWVEKKSSSFPQETSPKRIIKKKPIKPPIKAAAKTKKSETKTKSELKKKAKK